MMTMKLPGVASLALVGLAVLSLRADVDLSGNWNVAGTNFTAEARLPGTLAAAKLGTRWTERDFRMTMDLPQSEALVQEYQYVGKAVWSRTIELTEKNCRFPCELYLERVMWKSAAFWDGCPLGSRDSLATPHVYPLPRLTPGRHTLRLEIDNSCFYEFSRQSHAYGPNMQAVWNGVLGNVCVRRSHPLRQARVFAAAPANRQLRVEVPADFVPSMSAIVLSGLSITSCDVAPSPYRANWQMLRLGLSAEPMYWNDENPRLYTLTLRDAAADFAQEFRFGFRSFGTRGLLLTLNGQPMFLRGNVENANFARDGIPWMTKAEWRDMLSLLKREDGCNAIRFHTWCPPRAAFEAADELGMLLLPEAGIWTDGWMSDGAEVGNGKPVDDFVRRELKSIVTAYGNSPSFFSLSIGNELGNSNFPEMGKMIAEVRSYDPRALYYASSARKLSGADDFMLTHKINPKGMCRERLLPHTDWDYEAVYSSATLPTVAHEIGQWPVYPIWETLLSPFVGTMRPWNLSRHFETAKSKNALRFQQAYHAASARLNRIIYKEEVESFLRTPSCAGLQLLEVQDYTGQAEALVGWRDPFYALKPGFRDVPPFSSVWGPVSFLARFPRYTYEVGETYRARLLIRNLTASVLPAGTRLPYDLAGRAGEVVLAEPIAPGSLATVGTVERVLDASMTKARQTLKFGGNSWNFWVYPREEPCPLPAGVVETSDPEVMKTSLAAGRTVLYRGASYKSAKGQFKSVYWSARWFPVANTTAAALGTSFDTRHPVFDGFVTEHFTDWQWYSLAEGATVHALRGLPADYRPLALSVNDFHFSDLTATMFEVLVGSGRLFVCGYDLSAKTPEARRLRACVCRYLAGPPVPSLPCLGLDWLATEFAAERAPALDGAVYDCVTNLTGRVLALDLRGIPPTTGDVVLDFATTTSELTSGRGILEDRVFEVPFAASKGARVSAHVPVVREDFLDGKIAVELRVMTGPDLSLRRVRVIPESNTHSRSAE